MKYKYPCKDCEQRAINCHSVCEKYLEAKAAADALKYARMKEATADEYRLQILNRNKGIKIKEKMKRQ